MSIDPSCFPRADELGEGSTPGLSELASKGFSLSWLLLSTMVLLGGMTIAAAVALSLDIDNENASFAMFSGGALAGSVVLGLTRRESIFRESVIAAGLVAATFVYLMTRNDVFTFLWTRSLWVAAGKTALGIGLGVVVGGLMGARNSHRLGYDHPWKTLSLSLFSGAGVLFLSVMLYALWRPTTQFSSASGVMVVLFAEAAFLSGLITQAAIRYRDTSSAGAGMSLFVVFSVVISLIVDGGKDGGGAIVGAIIIALLAWLIGSLGASIGWNTFGREDLHEGESKAVPSARTKR